MRVCRRIVLCGSCVGFLYISVGTGYALKLLENSRPVSG